jgi:hypothetical protein
MKRKQVVNADIIQRVVPHEDFFEFVWFGTHLLNQVLGGGICYEVKSET